jgi:hypothetical protein
MGMATFQVPFVTDEVGSRYSRSYLPTAIAMTSAELVKDAVATRSGGPVRSDSHGILRSSCAAREV